MCLHCVRVMCPCNVVLYCFCINLVNLPCLTLLSLVWTPFLPTSTPFPYMHHLHLLHLCPHLLTGPARGSAPHASANALLYHCKCTSILLHAPAPQTIHYCHPTEAWPHLVGCCLLLIFVVACPYIFHVNACCCAADDCKLFLDEAACYLTLLAETNFATCLHRLLHFMTSWIALDGIWWHQLCHLITPTTALDDLRRKPDDIKDCT